MKFRSRRCFSGPCGCLRKCLRRRTSEYIPLKEVHHDSSGGQSRRSLGFLSQVRLLLWKHGLQKRRHWKVTLAEIMMPLIGAATLIFVRHLVIETVVSEPTTWKAEDLNSRMAPSLKSDLALMFYSPNSSLINTVMDRVNAKMRRDGLRAEAVGMETEEDIFRFSRLHIRNAKNHAFTITFHLDPLATTLPFNMTFTIRPKTDARDKWDTHKAFPCTQTLKTRKKRSLYDKHDFMYTQLIVSQALIHQWTRESSSHANTDARGNADADADEDVLADEDTEADLGVAAWRLQRIPYPPHIDDLVTTVVQLHLPSLILLSYMLSVVIVCKNLVQEKETQVKESMKLMGLTSSAYWTAWLLQIFAYLLLASVMFSVMLNVSVAGRSPVLHYSDFWVVLMFFIVYSAAVVAFCCFVGTLVSTANLAAALGGILFFVAFFPYYHVESVYQDMSLGQKLACCLSFNLAMACGVKTIGLYEGTGEGAQWSSFNSPPSVDDNFSLLHATLMLLLNTVIFTLLTWYVDNVMPGRYGVPRPWYFPLQTSYWRNSKRAPSTHDVTSVSNSRYFERDPTDLHVGICMEHLGKVFGQDKAAVKGTTLTMYEGQITVLLGHNGAGKTTTMSMLTGLTPPSFGTAYVDGYDIRSHMSSIRHTLGLCPQHNVLFDSLTVDEHLTFFAKLKGCPSDKAADAVSAMATEVGLGTKRAAHAETLSGGQKRKLCVGIALIGGSKVVILDEPSSGMDPAARRQMWEVLQRHRAGRTILLTTHFMDEADVLGDRIAIMAEGVVKCCGTSLFLKKLYGAGYHLVIVTAPKCDVSALTAVVQRVITGAQLESRLGTELSYLLPEDEGAKFAELFRVLEESCHMLGVTSFGVASTSMEEVFHREKGGGGGGGKVMIYAYNQAANQNVCIKNSSDESHFAAALARHAERVCTNRVGDSGATGGVDDVKNHLSPATYPISPVNGVPDQQPSTEVPGSCPSSGYADRSFQDGIAANGLQAADEKQQWTDVNIFPLGLDCDGNSPAPSAWDSGETAEFGSRSASALLHTRYERLSGIPLCMSQWWGMLVKKAIHTWRNRTISTVQLALPVIFTIAALAVDKAHPIRLVASPLTLDLTMFHGTSSFVSSGARPLPLSVAMATNYTALFRDRRHSVHVVDRDQYPDLTDFYLAHAEQVGLYTYNKDVLVGAEFEPAECADEIRLKWPLIEPRRKRSVADSTGKQRSKKSFAKNRRKSLSVPHVNPSAVGTHLDKPRRKQPSDTSRGEARFKKSNATFRLPGARPEIPAGRPFSRAAITGSPSAPVAKADNANLDEFLGSLWQKFAGKPNDTGLRDAVSYGCQRSSPLVTATAWYSGQPLHAKPVALGYLLNAVARQVTGQPHHLTVINHPMPKDDEHAALDSLVQNLRLGFFIGFSMLFGMCFLMTSFSFFLIRERQTGAKHLQIVSGVGPVTFWLACFTWDFVNYLLPCAVLLLVFVVFQVEAFTADNNLLLVILILVMAGLSVLPFVYLLHFLFVSPAGGFVALVVLFIITGMFAMTIVLILRTPMLMVEHVAVTLDWIFLSVFPHYCMGTAFSNVYFNKFSMDLCKNRGFLMSQSCKVIAFLGGTHPCCRDACGLVCVKYEDSYLSWTFPGIGRNIFFMGLHAVVYFALTIAVDFQLPQKLVYLCLGSRTIEETSSSTGWCEGPGSAEDSDVRDERKRIRMQLAEEFWGAWGQRDTLVLRDLYKRYKGLVAVDHVTVGVKQGECFGLLGQNGAGKTSTFRMLTGDLMLTAGDAMVAGHSVKTEVHKAQSKMGYCPQFDALLDQMTGRETLTMYARLRGVPESCIRRTVDNLISLFMLRKHADKETLGYSGGTKRKLSSAIALVGNPPLILLDEPTSGMDPGARRQLWNVLSEVRASGRTLVLTSHSMEECDALCTRIAIMVNGRFRCLGSPQHLKSKFGQGYTLTAKMTLQPDGTFFSSEPLVNAVSSKFPGTMTFDDHQGYIQLQVPQVPLSEVFAAMEWARSSLGVEDYSVHQSSLEQVFLTFTKAQLPPRQAPPNSFLKRCFCLA